MGNNNSSSQQKNAGKSGPLSAEVMATLKSRACSKDVMRSGTIFCQFFETDQERVNLLLAQLDAYDVEYEVVDAPDGKIGKVINITGATNKKGEKITGDVSKMTLSEKDRLPSTGTWNPEKGNGDWYPNSNDKPKGYPVEPSDDETSEKKGKRLEKGKQKAQIKRVDQILPMYDSKTGEIIRHPWGAPGDLKNGRKTIVAQIEALVIGHKKRHAKEGEGVEDYTFNGVLFENNKPLMEEYSMGTVKTNFYSTDRTLNFKMADELMAKQLNEAYFKENGKGKEPPYSIAEVKKYRETNDLTWHEDPDCQTMMKVPSILHANTAHNGGVSEEKSVGYEVFVEKKEFKPI